MKSGTVNIKDNAPLHFVQRYLAFDGRTVDLKEIFSFITELQKAIKDGLITKKSPLIDQVRDIQDRLIDFYNVQAIKQNNRSRRHKIKIKLSNKEKIEASIKGLGFLPYMVAAATGKAVEILTQRALSKKPATSPQEKQVNGLGCACEDKKPDPVKNNSMIMSASQMGKLTYESLKFNPYYRSIFGLPATNFDMCFYGEPGGGKTVFLLKFANYLAESFGPVLYVSDEEYGSATLIDKVNRFNIKNPRLDFSSKLISDKIDLRKYKFIFLDSVNSAGITLEDYKAIREKYPDTVFVLILQTTKSGSYRGGKDWMHETEINGRLFLDEKQQRMLAIEKDRYSGPRTVKI